MAIELDGFGDTMESHDEAQKSMDSGESTRPDGAGMTMLARTIRLCVVLVIDDLEFGGAQRQVVEVANNMDPARFDVHVCTLSDYVPLGSQLRDSATKLHTIVKKHKMVFRSCAPSGTHGEDITRRHRSQLLVQCRYRTPPWLVGWLERQSS